MGDSLADTQSASHGPSKTTSTSTGTKGKEMVEVVSPQAIGILLTPRDVADRLRMSLKWVEKHTQQGRIPGQVKLGRVWRYSQREIELRLLSGKEFLLPEGRYH